MKLRAMCLVLELFVGMMSVALAGNSIVQKCRVCYYDNQECVFTSIPATLQELRRGAYPLKGRAIVVDLFRPTKVDKVVIPLQKFELKHPDNASEANRMQVYTGLTTDKLTLAADAKVAVTAGKQNAIPTEMVTVTNLPEARYFVFYAPRTDKFYVFGIQDGKKELQVWADAPLAIDPAIAALPDVQTLDMSWARNALTLESCGFLDATEESEVATTPYLGSGGSSQIAWPWSKRVVEFSLKESRKLSRISIELKKLQMHFPEMTTGVENGVFYQSSDGKNFEPVAGKVEHLLYRQGNDVFAQVSISGDFSGKYFRLYVPWSKKYYVFGTRRLNSSIKAIPAGAALSEMTFPLYQTSGKVSMAFRLDAPVNWQGTLVLQTLDKTAKKLWSQKVTSDMLNKRNVVVMDWKENLPAGNTPVQLTVMHDGKKECSMSGAIFHLPQALTVPPPESTAWLNGVWCCGAENKTLKSAVNAGAVLEYALPATGNYAVYLFMAGKQKLKFKLNDCVGETQLVTWHPNDLADSSAGLNYLCSGAFNAGDILTLTASAPGAIVGEIVLLPLSEEGKAALNAAPANKPVVILHSDGYSDFFSRDVDTDYLDGLIAMAKRGNAFTFDWCVGTTAVNYPSKIASNFGMQKNPQVGREGDRKAIARLQKLLAVCDPIERLVTNAKHSGVRLSITIRCNPFYAPLNSLLNSQYFVDRPHCLLLRADGTTGYPQLSYAHEETKVFFLTLVKEVAAYHPDAIVLDFLRHPPFFGYDEPLIAEYKKLYGSFEKKDVGSPTWQKMCAAIMTEHIRNVRRALDEIDPSIALEISCDWEKYYEHGIDLETLLKEGLIDVVSPGIYEVGEKKYFPLAPYRTMLAASPKKVLLIPRVEGTIYGGDPTAAEEKGLEVIQRRSMSLNMFRALWLKFSDEGADGIRPFNVGGAWLSAALANQTELRRFELFEMPFLDFRTQIHPIQK